MTSALFILALIGLFAFPWPYAAVVAFIFALYEPPAGIALGILADTLYYTHGSGLPIATIAGIIATIVAFFINRFVKKRISV